LSSFSSRSLAVALAAKKAFPDRASVGVTGGAGLGYMPGNLEVLLLEKVGITVVHISNGGVAGYGPALGFNTERVSEPAEIVPALRRALDANTSSRPACIEFICCQYPVYGQWVGRSAE
jgi:thiamine pyrophosphate-dependent acetolactate synthase large subunit-like protein